MKAFSYRPATWKKEGKAGREGEEKIHLQKSSLTTGPKNRREQKHISKRSGHCSRRMRDEGGKGMVGQ